MSHPLVSTRTRRIAVALAFSALIAGAAGAQPQRPHPATPEPASLECLGDIFQWLVAEILGGGGEVVYAAERSELDSEIEVDPPTPRVRPEGAQEPSGNAAPLR